MSSTATMESPALEDVIGKAMRKLNVDREFALCSYLPDDGKRMHHFSFGKMKKQTPKDLICLLERHIIENDFPKIFPSKERAKKSISKNSLNLVLKKNQAQELFHLAKQSGNAELIELLKPAISLKDIQKELIQSIREKSLKKDLWIAYEDALRQV